MDIVGAFNTAASDPQVIDCIGYNLSTLGPLHLFDLFRPQIGLGYGPLRLYYLFGNAILSLGVEPWESTVESSEISTDKAVVFALNRVTWLRSVQRIIDDSTDDFFRLTFVMDKLDTNFTITFDTKKTKDIWKTTTLRLIPAARSTTLNTQFDWPTPWPIPSLSELTAELDYRIMQDQGSSHSLESHGPLQIYDALTVRKDGLDRCRYHVFLFQKALLFFQEYRAQNEDEGSSLRREDRLDIGNIKSASESTGQEYTLTINTRQGLGSTKTLVLIFNDRQTLDLWTSRLRQLMINQHLPESINGTDSDVPMSISMPHDNQPFCTRPQLQNLLLEEAGFAQEATQRDQDQDYVQAVITYSNSISLSKEIIKLVKGSSGEPEYSHFQSMTHIYEARMLSLCEEHRIPVPGQPKQSGDDASMYDAYSDRTVSPPPAYDPTSVGSNTANWTKKRKDYASPFLDIEKETENASIKTSRGRFPKLRSWISNLWCISEPEVD